MVIGEVVGEETSRVMLTSSGELAIIATRWKVNE